VALENNSMTYKQETEDNSNSNNNNNNNNNNNKAMLLCKLFRLQEVTG
jgi:hypothetical protein